MDFLTIYKVIIKKRKKRNAIQLVNKNVEKENSLKLILKNISAF